MAGDYKIVMNISNLASALSKEVTVNIVKTITLMIINAKSSASNLLSRSPSVHNTFPLESSVLFEAEHDGNVDIRHFTFTFGDGSHMNGTSDHIIGEHTYISKGEFNVTLRVTHQFGESWNFTVVTLKESIAGLKISDDAPTVLSESTKFTINMDKLGTDTLIEINLGNGQKILFGDNNSDVAMATADVRPVQASTKSITFLHTYKDIGLYDVKVYGWNDVSSMNLSHRTVTVKERCRYPDPQILSVGTNLSTALNVTNDKEIVIYARTKINCQASYKTIFAWKLEHYDFPVKVETELNKPSLTIPSRSLPYGIVTLRFTAKMKYIIDGIESQVVGFINVIPVALKATLVGGEFRKVSSKRWFRIDGSMSEDADVERGNLTGIRFYWYCRRVTETFPLQVDDHPSVTFKDISLHSRNRGCEGSGPRRLNYSTPDLKIGPGMLMENEMYVVKLIIRKDSREAFFEQTLKVLGKVLPDIAIK